MEAAPAWRVYCDGASRGNPGQASIGCVVIDPAGEVRWRIARPIGVATNNHAEYRAAIAGLEAAKQLGASAVDLRLDSELVVRQIEGRYRIRKPELMPLAQRLQELRRQFQVFSIGHIPRAQNKAADALANAALDGNPYEGPEEPETTIEPGQNSAEVPVLRGTAKQTSWANSIRTRLLQEIERELEPYRNLADPTTEGEASSAVKQIREKNSASWWIDRRNQTARELLDESL